MFILLLAVSITLPLLQQQQQQQLNSSLQPVCTLLLLTVLPPTLLSVEAADDGVTSDFQQTIYTVSVTVPTVWIYPLLHSVTNTVNYVIL